MVATALSVQWRCRGRVSLAFSGLTALCQCHPGSATETTVDHFPFTKWNNVLHLMYEASKTILDVMLLKGMSECVNFKMVAGDYYLNQNHLILLFKLIRKK